MYLLETLCQRTIFFVFMLCIVNNNKDLFDLIKRCKRTLFIRTRPQKRTHTQKNPNQKRSFEPLYVFDVVYISRQQDYFVYRVFAR